jgi:hypothetical protein
MPEVRRMPGGSDLPGGPGLPGLPDVPRVPGGACGGQAGYGLRHP